MTTDKRTGWQRDPYGTHELRFFSADGKPTLLVMDGGKTSHDKPPTTEPPQTERPPAPDPVGVPSPSTSPPSRPQGLPEVDAERLSKQDTLPTGSFPATDDEPASARIGDWAVTVGPAGFAGERSGGVEQGRPEQLSKPRKIAFAVVAGVLALSLLALAYVHRPRPSPEHQARAAPARTTTTGRQTTTSTTVGIPTALQPSADAAANALVSDWAAGNRLRALSVATGPAATTLFATPYAGAGLAIDRGCSSTFQPIVCTFGPPGGASPTDPIYEISVTQKAGGWYVSSVKIEN